MSSISILSSVSKGWLHEEGGFTFGERYYMDPLYRQAQDQKIDQFLQQRFPEHAFYNMESNLVQRDHWRPDYVYVGGIQPNLILGMCLGAEMAWYSDQDIDFVDINPLGHITSPDELPAISDILDHPVIKEFDTQIQELHETRPDLTVIPPFFWDTSGRATIHGFVTTSMKFYGEQIFIKMFEDPEFVKGLHEWLSDVYIALIRHYADLGNIPVTSVHTGECTGTMLRDSHYEEFVLPYINKLADALGPIRLHSCGLSDHLVGTMQKMPKLQVLDTGSQTSVEQVRQQFGSTLKIDIAPPLQVLLQNADPEEVLAWLDQNLAENDHGAMLIGFHLEPGYSIDNCLAIHDRLHHLGHIPKGRP